MWLAHLLSGVLTTSQCFYSLLIPPVFFKCLNLVILILLSTPAESSFFRKCVPSSCNLTFSHTFSASLSLLSEWTTCPYLPHRKVTPRTERSPWGMDGQPRTEELDPPLLGTSLLSVRPGLVRPCVRAAHSQSVPLLSTDTAAPSFPSAAEVGHVRVLFIAQNFEFK